MANFMLMSATVRKHRMISHQIGASDVDKSSKAGDNGRWFDSSVLSVTVGDKSTESRSGVVPHDMKENYFESEEVIAKSSLWEADFDEEENGLLYSNQLEHESLENDSTALGASRLELDDESASELRQDSYAPRFSSGSFVELRSDFRMQEEITKVFSDVNGQTIEQYQPGLTSDEIKEIEELEDAWRDDVQFIEEHNGSGSKDYDQQANWFVNPELIELNHYYLHNFSILDDRYKFTLEDRNFETFSTLCKIQGSLRIIMYSSSEFFDGIGKATDASVREQIEFSIREIVVESWGAPLRKSADSVAQQLVLHSKTRLSIHSVLVTHRLNSEDVHYKVFGSWISPMKPRDASRPLLSMSVIGLLNETNPSSPEFRITVSILPVRCHLTEGFISFVKDIAAVLDNVRVQETESIGTSSSFYCQYLYINPLEIKIDYHASSVNLKALKNGDFLQLLNVFPLDGLELSLKPVKLLGLNSPKVVTNAILEIWVTDIYKNQLHKIITGTSPFRGISAVGANVKGLFVVPLSDYKRGKRVVWKHITKGAQNLLQSVATETLSLTHQVSMFVANTITDIALDGPGKITGTSEELLLRNAGGRQSDISTTRLQPRNIQEGLQHAASTMTRELATTFDQVLVVPIRVGGSPSGVIKSVVRALPVAVLRPVKGVVEGISYTVLGLRNSLNPNSVAEEEDFWKIIEEL
jgi:hypothetical protein